MENVTSDEGTREQDLKERKSELELAIENRDHINKLLLYGGLILSSIGLFILIKFFSVIKESDDLLPIIILFILYGLLGIMSSLFRTTISQKRELQDINYELDMMSISNDSLKERAEMLFKNHHNELKTYYDENLKQSRVIFNIGIISIGLGFAIVCITLYFVLSHLEDELVNKLIIGGLGAIAAILTNFIGVIYLKMHAETTKSLTQFHNRFVNTHHFHFGNFLISKIEDPVRREEALANLALSINQTATLEEVNNEPNQGTQ